jgi:hypothetical protein
MLINRDFEPLAHRPEQLHHFELDVVIAKGQAPREMPRGGAS